MLVGDDPVFHERFTKQVSRSRTVVLVAGKGFSKKFRVGSRMSQIVLPGTFGEPPVLQFLLGNVLQWRTVRLVEGIPLSKHFERVFLAYEVSNCAKAPDIRFLCYGQFWCPVGRRTALGLPFRLRKPQVDHLDLT